MVGGGVFFFYSDRLFLVAFLGSFFKFVGEEERE